MIALAVALYRLLLFLLPGPFRAEYGREAVDLFEQMVRDAHAHEGRRAALKVVLEGWVGIVRGFAQELTEEAGGSLPRALWRRLTQGLALDFVHGSQALKHRPGTSLTVIATVAIAVGATTAVFSVIHGVLLRPLPYGEPERLVRIWQTYEPWADSSSETMRRLAEGYGPPAPLYFEWSRADVGLDSLGAYRDVPVTLQRVDGAELLRGQIATAGLFEALGVPPLLGRAIGPEDDLAGAPRVAVISEAFWRERFHARSNVLGEELRLGGLQHTVVGVMPEGFAAPAEEVGDPSLPAGGPRLWMPLTESVASGGTSLSVIGRLAPGVSLETATAHLEGAHAQLVAAGLDELGETGVRLEPLLESVVGDVRATLWFLLGAVALVLAVAAVNIANILTASGLTRRRELAVRVALGAAPRRVLQALFAECALLAVLGGLAGILLAWTAVPLLVHLLPTNLPRLEMVEINLGVTLFGLAVTTLTALAVGTLPALLAGRADPEEALRGSSRSVTASRGAGRMRGALVVSQVTLAFVLLVGATLLGSSFLRLNAVDRGFTTRGLAVVRVIPDFASHPTRAERVAFRQSVLERLERIPGVRATAMNVVPLSGFGATSPLYFEDDTGETVEASGNVFVGLGEALEVLGVDLLAGRRFGPGDREDSRPVVIVNQALAQRHWPGRSALGERLRVINETEPREVVGVAADFRHKLETDPEPAIVLPALQAARGTNDWLLRADGDLSATLQQMRRIVTDVSVATPVRMVLRLDDAIQRSVALPRSRTLLIVGLAVLAGLLALFGVYGILAFEVAQRTPEIGVRMTLGARVVDVILHVIGSGLRLVAVGVAIGLPVAWAASDAVRSFLYEVPPTDLLSYAGVAIGVLGVSAVAAYLPARRAAAVDPIEVLKSH